MLNLHKALVEDMGMTDAEARVREYYMKNIIMLFKLVPSLAILFYFQGELKAFIIVNLVLLFSRKYFGGIHFKEDIKCFISSLVIILAIIYGSYLNITAVAKVIIFLVVLISWWLYVPKGTSLFPIRREDVRRYKKRMALVIIVVSIFISIILPDREANLIVLSILANVLLVYPITYKLFGVQEGRG